MTFDKDLRVTDDCRTGGQIKVTDNLLVLAFSLQSINNLHLQTTYHLHVNTLSTPNICSYSFLLLYIINVLLEISLSQLQFGLVLILSFLLSLYFDLLCLLLKYILISKLPLFFVTKFMTRVRCKFW